MAYDPNDPADKQIVADAVAAALEEAQTEHETAVEGLKTKNRELLAKISRLRTSGGEGSADEVTRLEGELETAQGELRTAQTSLRTATRDLAKVTGERDTAQTSLQAESAFARDMVIENDLTGALSAANVAPQFVDGAKAMLANGVVVKEVDGKRKAFVGDKPLSEHVSEWAASDKGKAYVAAPNNAGGGSSANTTPAGQAGSKKINDMTLDERNAHFRQVGEVEFTRQFEAEKSAAK